MKIHSTVAANRLVRHILPLLLLGPLVATAAPPAADVDQPPTEAPDTELGGSLESDPSSSDGRNPFDTLEDSETPSETARYKYSVRHIEGNRRHLETVRASSEPLAYRKVREKHPEADSILLIEVRRDGERVDRSRRENGSGRTIGGPLSGRRSGRRSISNRSRRFNMLAATPKVPDSPFAKLIDQMHTQNIQNILRGKTFQDIDSRIRQAKIELERRRQAAERYRQQVLAAAQSGSSGSTKGKTGSSKGNSNDFPKKKKKKKKKPKKKKTLGDNLKSGGKPGKKNGDPAKPSSGVEGDSDINLGSGGPTSPDF